MSAQQIHPRIAELIEEHLMSLPERGVTTDSENIRHAGRYVAVAAQECLEKLLPAKRKSDTLLTEMCAEVAFWRACKRASEDLRSPEEIEKVRLRGRQ